jgi:hypothetical protein
MLKNGTLYQDLGANHFDKRAQGKHVLRLVFRRPDHAQGGLINALFLVRRNKRALASF